jgi:hypothetical protein
MSKMTLKQQMLKLLKAVIVMLVIGYAILISGCSTTVTRNEYERIVRSAMCNTLGAVHYKGREGNHDYFRAVWATGPTNFRIEVDQSPIGNHFPYTSDRRQWRQDCPITLSEEESKRLLKHIEPEQDNSGRPD